MELSTDLSVVQLQEWNWKQKLIRKGEEMETFVFISSLF